MPIRTDGAYRSTESEYWSKHSLKINLNLLKVIDETDEKLKLYSKSAKKNFL